MSPHERTTVDGASSEYEVHWMLVVPQGQAERYGKIIRHAWWTFGGVTGQRRLVCDHANSAVVAVVRLVSDDLPQAIASSHDHVLEPLRRVGLSTPDPIVVIVNHRGTAPALSNTD